MSRTFRLSSRARFATCAALALLATLPLTARAQSCPASEYTLGGAPHVASTAPTADTTWAPPGYSGSFRVAWDLRAGNVTMYHCCSLAETHAWVRDAFDVTGVAPGTPVSLVVEFDVHGAVFTSSCGGTGCSGTFGAALRYGEDSTVVVHPAHLFNGRAEFHDVLWAPVTIVAGQPQTIEFQLFGHRNVGGSHGAEGQGQIRFSAVPAGVSVVSCQGFGASPTPTRRASWGALKTIYR